MKYSLLVTLGVLLFSIVSCRDKDSDQLVSGNQAIIDWQDCAFFTDHDLTVCFIDAKESRCPCTTNCIVEGVVDATFHVTSAAGIDTTFTLTTNSNPVNLPNSTSIHGKTITFVGTEIDFCADYGQYEKYKAIVKVQ